MTRLDFWNAPDRWEGVDPNAECFWMRRRRDVIDVRHTKDRVMLGLKSLERSLDAQRAYNELHISRPGELIPYPHTFLSQTATLNGLSNQRQNISPLTGLFGGIL